MKILITGDRGFVGTETKEYLFGDHTYIGYDLMDGHDIRDLKQLDNYVKDFKPDRILHLAAIARFSEADKDPLLAYETNVVGTNNVVEVVKKYHIPLVYASTGSVYMPIETKPPIFETDAVRGNSVYGCSKAIGEYLVQLHTPHIILRYAHLYGKEKRHHGLIGGFLGRINKGLTPTLYGGQQSNDFTYIKDIARANAIFLTSPWDRWNQAYNIGTGEELTALKAGEMVCKIAQYSGKIDIKKGRTVDPQRFVYNIDKARDAGFTAKYSFQKGLEDMYN